MRNQDWSTLDIGKAENKAWFYLKERCFILRHKTPVKTIMVNT